MKQIALILLIALGINLTCHAEHVIIVHPENTPIPSEKDIQRLYLAKLKTFPNGTLAIPLNHLDNSDVRKSFDSSVIGKNPSQMKSYWAKLIFTGKATPIKQVMSDDEILELVSVNPGAIGYIDSSKVTSKVKVAHKF